jgi:hypothetical protein
MARIKPKWIQDFVAAKRRGTQGRKIPRESSLAYYADTLNRGQRNGLNLESCSMVQLNDYLDKLREGHEILYYIDILGVIKDALVFLGLILACGEEYV